VNRGFFVGLLFLALVLIALPGFALKAIRRATRIVPV